MDNIRIMKNNNELKTALETVLLMLESDPKTVEEWQVIEDALRSACAYSATFKTLRRLLNKE